MLDFDRLTVVIGSGVEYRSFHGGGWCWFCLRLPLGWWVVLLRLALQAVKHIPDIVVQVGAG